MIEIVGCIVGGWIGLSLVVILAICARSSQISEMEEQQRWPGPGGRR